MLDLTKSAGAEHLTGISILQAGVAWKTSGGGQKGWRGKLKRAKGTDLDLACVALSGGRAVRMAWFDNEDAFDDGSLTTLGDNTTGRGKGDDETVVARLDDIPAQVDALVFIVSAYKEGVSFDKVEAVTLNVYDGGPSGTLLGSYWPDIDSRKNACVMATAKRGADGWTIQIVNKMGDARTRDALLQLAKRHAA
ncbi:TerD family protein [Streptomyces sp. P9(2023)]|uniref:TerD family protein n=1 Tax=Streptomyces sp. P9(2023) TaxID=3064394 RepID=UPI0028F450E7|nr:TerD family protein [Streptomyces sp. P9(2023)]MDT9690574.1 TerD family protein [Streptomyces sp. P9(2023)]